MSCPRSLPKPPWPQRAGFALCPHAPFPHALCPDLRSPDAGHTQLHPPRRPHSISVASILCTCVLQDRGPCGHSRRHALSPRCHGWGGGREVWWPALLGAPASWARQLECRWPTPGGAGGKAARCANCAPAEVGEEAAPSPSQGPRHAGSTWPVRNRLPQRGLSKREPTLGKWSWVFPASHGRSS